MLVALENRISPFQRISVENRGIVPLEICDPHALAKAMQNSEHRSLGESIPELEGDQCPNMDGQCDADTRAVH